MAAKSHVNGTGRRDSAIAINAKEAYKLLHAPEVVDVPENGVVRLPKSVVIDILGDLWETKLDTNRSHERNRLIQAESYPPGSDDHYLYIDKQRLEAIAVAPVAANEISRMLERRFGKIELVERFARKCEVQDNPPEVHCSETFMSGFLGGAWRDRLRRSAVPFKEEKKDTGTEVYLPFKPLYTLAENALHAVAARRADSRRE